MEFEPKGAKFKLRKAVHAMDHMVTMFGFIGDERIFAEIFD
jgi:hypothetical protein